MTFFKNIEIGQRFTLNNDQNKRTYTKTAPTHNEPYRAKCKGIIYVFTANSQCELKDEIQRK